VLAAQPRRRAGLQLWAGLRLLASLRELRLERQGGAGLPTNALACRELQGLTLLGCEANDWPASPYHYSELGMPRGRGRGRQRRSASARMRNMSSAAGAPTADAPTLPHALLLQSAAGEGGCVGHLASLHLDSLRLAAPIPSGLWKHLAPGLTALTWRGLTNSPPPGVHLPGFDHMQARH
jgi:hypothetical protein